MRQAYFYIIGTNPARTLYDRVFVETISEVDLYHGSRTFDKPSAYDSNRDVSLSLSFGYITSKSGDVRVHFLFADGDQILEESLSPLLEVGKEVPHPMLGFVILADSEYLDLDTENDTSTPMSHLRSRMLFEPRSS